MRHSTTSPSGGAAIASLWEETEQTYLASLSSLTTRLQDQTLGIRELAGTIGQLWYALNTCNTLNPRHRPEQANKSQLAQVADRQPRILLINIGSNEGLFTAGFAGDFSDAHRQNCAVCPISCVSSPID